MRRISAMSVIGHIRFRAQVLYNDFVFGAKFIFHMHRNNNNNNNYFYY